MSAQATGLPFLPTRSTMAIISEVILGIPQAISFSTGFANWKEGRVFISWIWRTNVGCFGNIKFLRLYMLYNYGFIGKLGNLTFWIWVFLFIYCMRKIPNHICGFSSSLQVVLLAWCFNLLLNLKFIYADMDPLVLAHNWWNMEVMMSILFGVCVCFFCYG